MQAVHAALTKALLGEAERSFDLYRGPLKSVEEGPCWLFRAGSSHYLAYFYGVQAQDEDLGSTVWGLRLGKNGAGL